MLGSAGVTTLSPDDVAVKDTLMRRWFWSNACVTAGKRTRRTLAMLAALGVPTKIV